MSDELRRLADGRYELFEAIGSGGMATVYRAQDHRLGVARAIKVLLPAYASKDRVRARFEAEARTMAVLDHPNIVRVYDVGATSDTAWIVMELVEGSSMLSHIGDFGMSVEDCLNVGVNIAAALESAHAHGVVHRDIKPHNVLMSNEGAVRITDFGIARSAGLSEDSLTKTGTVMGTWAFMAPEQRVNAKSVDHTADIYGAGATLFAMATGQTPMDLFAADLDPAMMAKVPEPLVPVIRKATRYNREDRYPDARSLLMALEEIREALGIQTEPTNPAMTVRQMAAPATTRTPSPSSDETSDVSLPTNVTYVDTGAEEPFAGRTAVEAEPNDTPLPYRPAVPAAVVRNEPSEPAVPVRTSRLQTRDKLGIAAAITLIAFLLVGGFLKRTAPVANAPVATPDPVADVPPTAASSERQSEPQPGITAPIPKTESVTAPQDQPGAKPETTAGQPPKPVRTPEVKPSATAPAATNSPSEAPKADSPSDAVESAVAPTEQAVSPGAPTPDTLGPPSIDHTPVSVARMGAQMPLTVRIQNLTPIETRSYRVTAYFRPVDTAQYRSTTLVRNRSTWTGAVPVTAAMERGLEYFIRAESTSTNASRLQRLKSGSNLRPHRVRVSSP
ncbi:MAG: protein kinase [Myxococcota bacterium]|nr:protein kinase [Myxococcota bacterium]